MPSRFTVNQPNLGQVWSEQGARNLQNKAMEDNIAMNPLRKRQMELGIQKGEMAIDDAKLAEGAGELYGYMTEASQGGGFDREAYTAALQRGVKAARDAGDNERAMNLSKITPEAAMGIIKQAEAKGVLSIPKQAGSSGGGKTGRIQEYEMYAADQEARGLPVESYANWDAGIDTAVAKATALEEVKANAAKMERAQAVIASQEKGTPEWYKAQEEIREAQKALNDAQDREQAAEDKAQAAQTAQDVDQRYAGVVFDDIGRALELIDSSPALSTGLVGAASKAIPGTPGYKLNELLEPLRASVSFKRLDEMRKASPTGGALGQVSEIEIKLLGSVMGSFEQGMGAEALKFNLKRAQDMFALIVHGDTTGSTLSEKEISDVQEQQTKGITSLPSKYSSDVSEDQWNALSEDQRKAFIEAGK